MKEPLNQWLAFIDMERGDLLEMAEKENKIIKEAKENYDVLTGDDEVKRLAEIRLMSQLEEQAALESAKDKGLEQGKKEGLEQGKKEGLEQGKKEKTHQLAKKMKEQKIDIKTIRKITGLSEKEILKL